MRALCAIEIKCLYIVAVLWLKKWTSWNQIWSLNKGRWNFTRVWWRGCRQN